MVGIYRLTPGQKYRVIKEFKDFDHITHLPGETWIFISLSFLPYDDGYTLHVNKDNQNIAYRLQDREEQQMKIIDNFMDFVEPCN